jgi:NADP-dependent 3-hydroxy acid dehydrogenase YdfG
MFHLNPINLLESVFPCRTVKGGTMPLTGKDVATVVYFAAIQPAHVCLNDIVVTPTAQANSTTVNKT